MTATFDNMLLADILIGRFGDFGRVLKATDAQLLAVPGMGETQIKFLHAAEEAAMRLIRAKAYSRDVLSSYQAVLDYCHAKIAHRDTEAMHVLYLDRKNCLVADETLWEGTIDHVPVYPREICKRAIALGAAALLVIHNHPSGDPTPSRSDIEMTAKLKGACAALDIQIHDHLVIGHGRDHSFRASGQL